MGRVTIKDIYWELSSDEMTRNFLWDGCKDIEIIPRKMLEMTIDYCLQNEAYFESMGRNDVAIGLRSAREYAESLLKVFEEDENE